VISPVLAAGFKIWQFESARAEAKAKRCVEQFEYVLESEAEVKKKGYKAGQSLSASRYFRTSEEVGIVRGVE